MFDNMLKSQNQKRYKWLKIFRERMTEVDNNQEVRLNIVNEIHKLVSDLSEVISRGREGFYNDEDKLNNAMKYIKETRKSLETIEKRLEGEKK